jgi:hypothetical protein
MVISGGWSAIEKRERVTSNNSKKERNNKADLQKILKIHTRGVLGIDTKNNDKTKENLSTPREKNLSLTLSPAAKGGTAQRGQQRNIALSAALFEVRRTRINVGEYR